MKKIHRLIAEAFIPNPENKPCIDHINTIRHDNRIENLRWATYKENGNNEITKTNLSNSQKVNQNLIENLLFKWICLENI